MVWSLNCQAGYSQIMFRLQCKEGTETDQDSPALAQEMKLEVKHRRSEHGRVLESSESYGGFPSILHVSLIKVKKYLRTFFMKDKTEQFSDFIFGW